MEKQLRIPPGISLLLIGSGIYWVLSSQLISSFTVLFPDLFQSLPSGQVAIRAVGTMSLAIGLWIIQTDIDEFRRLTNARIGFVYVLPIALVALDLYSTVVTLAQNSQVMELNPFVASVLQYGSVVVFSFLISYLALSQGLALLMLRTGAWLFGNASSLKILPFVFVCGASSFGAFSNLLGMALGYQSLVYVLGGISAAVLSTLIYQISSRDVIKTSRLN